MSVAGDMLPGSSQVQGVWAKQLQHVRITGVCVPARSALQSLQAQRRQRRAAAGAFLSGAPAGWPRQAPPSTA